MPNPPKAKLSALTGLRFVAAMHVVLFHEAQWIFDDLASLFHASDWLRSIVGKTCSDELANWVRHLGASGTSSVSLFFVLSGFILAYNYRDTLGRSVSVQEFYHLRFARIYPVYLCGILLTLPLIVYRVSIGIETAEDATRQGVLNLLLAQSWYPPDALSWNGPSWSLSVETFFYGMFPLILRYIIILPRRTVLYGSIVFCIATQVLVVAGKQIFCAEMQTSQGLYSFVNCFPLLRFSEFGLGIAITLLPHSDSGERRFGQFAAQCGSVLGATACVLTLGWNAGGGGQMSHAPLHCRSNLPLGFISYL